MSVYQVCYLSVNVHLSCQKLLRSVFLEEFIFMGKKRCVCTDSFSDRFYNPNPVIISMKTTISLWNVNGTCARKLIIVLYNSLYFYYHSDKSRIQSWPVPRLKELLCPFYSWTSNIPSSNRLIKLCLRWQTLRRQSFQYNYVIYFCVQSPLVQILVTLNLSDMTSNNFHRYHAYTRWGIRNK